MEKKIYIEKITQEIHLYSNKIEALIKDSIWIISWIGGINSIHNLTDKKSLGGAYFIFSLSLLMEFAPQINKKSYLWSKIFHTSFCSSIAIIMLMAVGLLVEGKCSYLYIKIMYYLSITVVVYIILDFFILWLGIGERNKNMRRTATDDNTSSDNLAVQKILEFLNNGKLGNINEEVNSRE